MPHPDLNELREKIKQEKAKGARAAQGRKTKKVFLLFVAIAVICFAVFYQQTVFDYAKAAYHSSYTYVAGLFTIDDGLEDITVAAGEELESEPVPTQVVLVASQGANIREDPDMEADVATVVRQGTELTYQENYDRDGDMVWMKVTTANGEKGWISDVIVQWDEASLALLEEEAAAGNTAAMTALGSRYEEGIALEEDTKEAFSWYEKAADAGNAEAQFIVGWFYENGEGGVRQNNRRAFDYYQMSAMQGHEDAMNNIGYMYAYGLGVRKNGDRSRQWFEKAIEYNSREAIANLAVLYLQGRNNLEQDVEKGVQLMKKAADEGDQDAIEALKIYEEVSETEFLQRMNNLKPNK